MSSLYSIQNSDLYLEIDSLGAEWKNLLAFGKQRSCLWSAKKDIWPRHAPILFPVVGKLQKGQYSYKDQVYALSPHGFARDSVFKLIQRSETSVSFSLTSSPTTKGFYPFDFNLEISYSLDGNTLNSTYSVTNLESEKMLPFSIGAHPGFSFEWLPPGKTWQDVVFEFDRNEGNFSLLNSEGLLDSSLKSDWTLESRKIKLHALLFNRDALILSPVNSGKIDMFAEDASQRIRMRFEGASAFGLWSKKVEEFVCLEPWWGIPDVVGHNGQFKEKKGLIWIGPNQSHTVSWKIEFINVDKA